MRVSKPSVAVVYADAFGEVAYFGGRPLSWSQQVMSKYRTCYEVDISDHQRTARLDSTPLPSQGDIYFFRSEVLVGFRATDPAEVVRRNITDALPVVYNHLIDVFRPVTRQYKIDDAAGAESQLNLLFLGSHQLDEGITIYRCTVRLRPDQAAQHYLDSLNRASRNLNLGSAEHEVAIAGARHEAAIDAVKQDARIEAERKELAATAGRRVDLQSLIQAHLAKHPDQTDYALELLQRHELAMAARMDVNDQRTMDLARYMMEQGLIQAVDIEMLRKDTLGRVQQLTSQQPAAVTAGSWDDPLPGDPPPVKSLPAPPAAAAGQAASSDTSYAIPVYLAIDESPADDSYLEALDRGVRALPQNLARYPDIIGAIRIAVLGYAADMKVRMPLTVVEQDSYVPSLTPREGANLAEVLEDLRERISEDVGRLKGRGLTVGRPTIYLLSAAASRDATAWDAALRRLTDRVTFAYAPNILAFGIGEAPAEIIIAIAEKPGSRGWVAHPGTSWRDAAESYMASVQESILNLGRAHLTGHPDMGMPEPGHFRPIGNRE
jgi:uncharacterized protein YegL